MLVHLHYHYSFFKDHAKSLARFFVGIGFAPVNQCGENGGSPNTILPMVPPSVYNGVRRADGGFFLFNHPALYGKVSSG